jgi:hypothetical protein
LQHGGLSAGLELERIRNAFVFNTRPWHSIFRKSPVGWGGRTQRRLQRVIEAANSYVQRLNDTFTDPSGDLSTSPISSPSLAVVAPINKEATTDEPGQSNLPDQDRHAT